MSQRENMPPLLPENTAPFRGYCRRDKKIPRALRQADGGYEKEKQNPPENSERI